MTREMKDSVVEWIGEIPKEWEISKVKHRFISKKNILRSDNFDILKLARKGIQVRDISTGEGQIASDYSKYNSVERLDILINPMDLISGDNCNISEIEGVISPAYINLKSKEGVNPYFYNYYFKLQYWLGSFFTHGKGVSFDNRWTLNDETLRNFYIVYPTLREQNEIVFLLDGKLNKIENIILDTRQSIIELKKYKQSLITEVVTKGLDKNVEMKDSGIEWVGKIPKDYFIPKLGNITSKIGSGKTPYGGENVYVSQGILFLRSQNIYNEGLNLESPRYISLETDKEMSGTRVFYDDVLLNITGGSIGRSTVYNRKKYANVNQHVCIIRCNQNIILSKWLHFCIISDIGKQSISFYQTGGNREGLNFSDISKIRIPVPRELEIQKKIINILEEKTSKIDRLIKDKEQIIKEYEEYKKSLIYEYVTGKK
ncbi:hypothetical protein CKN99_01315 [Carnobacterium maltaromaticum]|uniref:restriction endonuclease subunit S n=1 Tax=Carnobacterium maltaromaticum TaxID=2751 RepID=UPI0010723B5D|nr:restriction endonuclease subunit S [Carnobacterium maltaromaticum]MDT1945382.1 restriction endonuclease subunit S [Carnobacterium maltaromaticum]MDT1999753.1 restriction endonuclease subunit S [Carnobacterium maltaromaticum]TFJ32370.1 hypothetical protein CKN90_01315 [Carnobacterium maltaromaticum]TFJ35720.1 hypothetical protein CKN98_01315 [Carnobacterium maltaromaticum]TFJ39538.1 hypothetical protein CKN88_01315 [Carnobacterium maltaromaticum]